MKITIDTKKELRDWIHVEKYQNTTLRYTPDKKFPKIMEQTIGKPEIIRLFVTLDEVWDYRDDSYDWDYKIGVNKYENDQNHYHYDWHLTEPSPLGVTEEEYLISHAEHSEKVLLNVRRYEQEIIKGIITLEKYQEVLYKVLEHYKKICPNIVYIEICNEVELINFGNLKMSEYYQIYKVACKVIDKLNCTHNYEYPLLIGGFGMAFGVSHFDLWKEFLTLLSQDKNRRIDFYSFHEYHMNTARIMEFYVRHQQLIRQLNLPDLPLFMTEYGMRTGVGDAGRPYNLQNAGGEIPGMILASYCDGLKVFPWCTFHNPNQQLGRTMFVQDDKKEYIPTPSAHVMTMFSQLGNKELWINEYTNNSCVATRNNDTITFLMTNVTEEKLTYEWKCLNLENGRYEIKEFLVDEIHNNYLNDKNCRLLKPTREWTAKSDEVEGKIELTLYSFCFYKITKA